MALARFWPIAPAVAAVSVVGLAIGVGAAPAQQKDAASSVPPAIQLFETYPKDPVVIVRMMPTFRTLNDSIRQHGVAWIRAGGRDQIARRRLIVAICALELGRRAINEFAGGYDLLAWASERMREGTPDDNERLWRHALLAVYQGGANGYSVERELNLARTRFPKEPRWLLIRGWWEWDDWRSVLYITPPLEDAAEVPRTVIRSYEAAAAVPALAGEANTHLALVHLSAGRPDQAIKHADAAIQGTSEADLRMLANLFRGWARLRLQQLPGAIEDFRAGYRIYPASQSVGLWLARSLYMAGRQNEAESIVEDVLRNGVGSTDPWRLYPRGDIRLWPRLVAALREAIK